VQAGDTFLLKDKAVDDHLWIIVSDPSVDDQKVLFVSMTTYGPSKEAVCLLNPGDHPFVRHQTCIAYDFARATSLQKLTALKDAGLLEMSTPVAAGLLIRIRRGLSLSKRIRSDHLELMLDQGLLD